MSPDTTFHASLGTARVYRASRGAIDAGILGQHTAVEFSRLNFGRCSAARPELRPVAWRAGRARREYHDGHAFHLSVLNLRC